jgi:tRNA threonylcarbamoyladenosine biosynthesis protein TsaB
VVSERHDGKEDYSAWLLPAVERTLAAGGFALPDVDLFSAAAGPGSFTGLRVGLTSVKAWGEVYQRPVAAVSRLEALAHQANSSGAFVASFVDARREQVFGGLYHRRGEELRLVGEEAVISPAAFIDFVSKETGAAAVAWVSLDAACLTKEPAWVMRAARREFVVSAEPLLAPAIGVIATRRAQTGRVDDPLTLDANYVRRPDAEIFWKGVAGHGR